MALEAGDGFISGLVITNPVNATDQVAQGDDHLRLIKTALKGTFPNLNGAVNATPAQLNVLATDGAGAGMLADIAAIADPGADRVLGWDESANAVIAFSLSTGLTSSGTALLIDTTVVPRLAVANVFTATQSISAAAPHLQLVETDAAADNQRWGHILASERYEFRAWNDAVSASGLIYAVERTGTVVDEFEINATLLDFNGALDLSGAATIGGALTAATLASSTSTTLVAGTTHFISGTATLPNLTAGQWVEVVNDSGSAITINVNGSDTTYWSLTGATIATSFTLEARGRLSAVCNAAGSGVYVAGSGISAAS